MVIFHSFLLQFTRGWRSIHFPVMGTKESAVSKASPVGKKPRLFEWWRWHRCRGPLKNHSWRRIGYAHIKDQTFWCLPLLHFRLHQVVKNRLSPWDIQCDMMIMMTSNPIHVRMGRLGSRWRHVAFAHWLVWELSSASPMVCICCWRLLLTFFIF